MKFRFIFILTFFVHFYSSAQTPVYGWAKKAGGTGQESGRAIVTDDTGNVFTAGIFNNTVDFDPGAGVFNMSSAGGDDIFIQKLDPNGNLLWAKRIGNANSDVVNAITTGDSGSVCITGRFYGSVDFDPGDSLFSLTPASGSSDLYVLKLRANGDFAWAKKYGGSSLEEGFAITSDDNNLYFTGDYDLYTIISKLDFAGNTIWSKQIPSLASRAIALDNSGAIYLAGFFYGATDVDPGTGVYTLTPSGSTDAFVIKLDPSGNFTWAKNIGGAGTDTYGYSMVCSPAGNVYMGGEFKATIDANPGAGTANLTSAGGRDGFVVKLDAGGNYLWSAKLGGPYDDKTLAVGVDAEESVYSTGVFLTSPTGSVDFDPGAGVFNLAAGNHNAIFIQKLDASGSFKWARQIGYGTTFNYNEGRAIVIDPAMNVYSTGSYTGATCDFDPTAAVANLPTAGGYEAYVLKWGQQAISTGIAEQDAAVEFGVYPNPTNGSISIEFNGLLKNNKAVLEIYNAVGQKVFTQQVAEGSTRLSADLSAQQNGMYFIMLHVNGTVYNQRLIKQ